MKLDAVPSRLVGESRSVDKLFDYAIDIPLRHGSRRPPQETAHPACEGMCTDDERDGGRGESRFGSGSSAETAHRLPAGVVQLHDGERRRRNGGWSCRVLLLPSRFASFCPAGEASSDSSSRYRIYIF